MHCLTFVAAALVVERAGRVAALEGHVQHPVVPRFPLLVQVLCVQARELQEGLFRWCRGG